MATVLSRKEIVWAALCCALVVTLFLSSALVTGRFLSPADMLFNYHPWHAQQPPNWTGASNDLLTDSVTQFEPWLKYSAERLRNGTLPLWNPNNMLGAPFIGNMQSSVFFPLNWPAFLWPDGHMLVLRAWLKLFIAAFGVYILARDVMKVRILSASIASITFTFGAFMTVWLLHPHTATVIWLPWLWWATARLVDRPSLRWTVALAAIVALSIFAGHIESAYHMAIVTGLFLLFRVWQTGSLQAGRVAHVLGLWVAAYALGGLASAVQILPFLEYSNQSMAVLRRTEREATPFWLPVQYAWTALNPDMFGNPARHNSLAMPVNYNESANYSGLLPLVLAPLSVFVRDRKQKLLAFFLIGIMLLSIGVIYGAPIVFDVALMVPGMKMVFNHRLTLVVEFALALLAALGVEAILQRLPQNRRQLTTGIGLVVLIWFGVGVGVPWLFENSFFQVPRDSQLANQVWRESLIRTTLILVIVCAVLFGALWLYGRKPLIASALLVLLPFLLLADLWQAHTSYLPYVDPANYYPSTEATQFLQAQKGLFRVVAPPGMFQANTNLSYGLSDLRGYDAIEPQLYYQLAFRPALKQDISEDSPPSPILDLLNVRYLMVAPGTNLSNVAVIGQGRDPQFVRVVDGGALNASVFENRRAQQRAWLTHRVEVEPDAASRPLRLADPTFDRMGTALLGMPLTSTQVLPVSPPTAEMDKVTIIAYQPEKVLIETRSSAPGVLILSDIVFPGWKAYVDNAPAPILTADHALRSVYLTAGQHSVRFEYEPESFKWGAVTTMGTLLLLVLLLALRVRVPQNNLEPKM